MNGSPCCRYCYRSRFDGDYGGVQIDVNRTVGEEFDLDVVEQETVLRASSAVLAADGDTRRSRHVLDGECKVFPAVGFGSGSAGAHLGLRSCRYPVAAVDLRVIEQVDQDGLVLIAAVEG